MGRLGKRNIATSTGPSWKCSVGATSRPPIWLTHSRGEIAASPLTLGVCVAIVLGYRTPAGYSRTVQRCAASSHREPGHASPDTLKRTSALIVLASPEPTSFAASLARAAAAVCEARGWATTLLD